MALDLTGRRVGVLGMGRSGISAARLIHRLGGTALISERKTEAELGDTPRSLRADGIQLEFGGHARLTTERFDIVVVSPGAVLRDEWLAAWSSRGTEIWSEFELSSRCYDGRWIAVTGSNGKTTTVTLLTEMLRAAGLRAQSVGNIGTAWSELLPARDVDIFVVEVSSFQMEFTHSARPTIAVLLNVLENHLDRHGDLTTYGLLKLKLARRQTADDIVVLNGDDAFLMQHAASLKSRRVEFGTGVNADWQVVDDAVFMIDGSSAHQLLHADEWHLTGHHNLLNAAAAAAAAFHADAPLDAIRSALILATPVEQRIEVVRELRGIRFYNDSKSTNLTATITAGAAVAGKITLLFGGQPKLESFAPLGKLLGNKLAHLIVFGEATAKVRQEVPVDDRIIYCDDLSSALTTACGFADADAILLSPGCASYDQFNNFEERGTVFKSLVRNIT